MKYIETMKAVKIMCDVFQDCGLYNYYSASELITDVVERMGMAAEDKKPKKYIEFDDAVQISKEYLQYAHVDEDELKQDLESHSLFGILNV